MTLAQLLLSAILSIYPYMSGNNRACIQRNFDAIASVASSSYQNFGVPQSVILAVGFLETHLGCDRGGGGNWGAPISQSLRHVAGTPLQAAQSLQTGFRVCHTWEGAISRFRSGACRIPQNMAHYPANAISIITRISTISEIPLPVHLYR